MSVRVRFTALFAAWLVASLMEIRGNFGDMHTGINMDGPTAPHQWHGELPLPQPVLLTPPLQPLPRMLNNSAEVAAQHLQEQSERDALFTMKVAGMTLRNAALFTLASHHGPTAG